MGIGLGVYEFFPTRIGLLIQIGFIFIPRLQGIIEIGIVK